MSFGLSLISAMQKEHLSARFAFLDLALSQNQQNLSCVKLQVTFLQLLSMSRIKKKSQKEQNRMKM